MTVPARRPDGAARQPEDQQYQKCVDALDRLAAYDLAATSHDLDGNRIVPAYIVDDLIVALPAVREALERLREERDKAWAAFNNAEDAHDDTKQKLWRDRGLMLDLQQRAVAAEAEVRQLREERDAEERSRGERITVGLTFQEHVERWLTSNHKRPDDVMWARFPLGMVGLWIERAQNAERELARYGRVAESPWSFHRGSLRERLEWCRDQHAYAAANPPLHPPTREQKADFDRACVEWYGEMLDQLRALLSASPPQGHAAEGTSPGATGPSFIPRDTDEYPSDAMPSAGHSDWREEAEWWQRTCEYWRARALGESLPDGDCEHEWVREHGSDGHWCVLCGAGPSDGGTPNGADRLAQIEAAAEDAEGGRWCSMETADVLALVEIARALEWYAERRNYLPPAGRHGDGLVERWIFEQDSFDGEGPGARARSALARLGRPAEDRGDSGAAE